MASDEDYMSFLNKANAEPSAGVSQSATTSGHKKIQLKAVDEHAQIPQELAAPTQNEEWIYVSDADEPFVPVSLKLPHGASSGLPDVKGFSHLVNHPEGEKAGVEVLSVEEWDRRGSYKDVVEGVRKACEGAEVRVYRVELGGTRVEYWVVGVREKEGRLVGVKALAVES
jgi:hypothetical protein